MAPLKLALLGAGIFARDTYVPLLKNYPDDVALAAVWSRSQQSVEQILPSIKEYSSSAVGYWGDDGLEKILQDPEIEGAIVVLAVQTHLEVVEKCLAAGKHVMQEKPIAATLAHAVSALKIYREQPKSVWLFGENFRFENVFLEASEAAKSIGNIIKIDLLAELPMNPKNKHYNTAWRRDLVGNPGGYLLENIVHSFGALSVIAERCGCGVPTTASGLLINAAPEVLPPPDTLVGWCKFKDGTPSSISITFAAEQMNWSMRIVGTKGTVEVMRGGWGGSRGGYMLAYKSANDMEASQKVLPFSGLDEEVKLFTRWIRAFKEGNTNLHETDDAARRGMPEGGVRDVALVDAFFKSTELGGQPVDVLDV